MNYFLRFLSGESRRPDYSLARKSSLDFESCGGERHFPHDAAVELRAQIYYFPTDDPTQRLLMMGRD